MDCAADTLVTRALVALGPLTIDMYLPALPKIADEWGEAWERVLDTCGHAIPPEDAAENAEAVRASVVVADRSVVLLRRLTDDDAG